jgi:hypothetical protein
MLSKPCPKRPELDELLRKSKEVVDAMTPEARAAMFAEQRRSFVRGQIGMGSDADEAAYASALRSSDTETLRRLDQEAAARVARAEKEQGL